MCDSSYPSDDLELADIAWQERKDEESASKREQREANTQWEGIKNDFSSMCRGLHKLSEQDLTF